MARLIILGAPLVLGLLERGHPAVLRDDRIVDTLTPIATWWTVLHVAQVPLFALLGLGVYFLLRPLHSRSARFSRWAVPVAVLLTLSGLLLSVSHIRPIGPLACLALLIASAWIESVQARWRGAPLPTAR